MGTDAERQDTRKAMGFDLYALIDSNQAFDDRTKEEIKKMIFDYLVTANQK